MPYIDYPSNSLIHVPYLMDETPAIDYRREDIQKKIRKGDIEGIAAPRTGQNPASPPSCAAIAICGSRNGYYVILDTDDGYIYWVDPNGQYDEPEPKLIAPLNGSLMTRRIGGVIMAIMCTNLPTFLHSVKSDIGTLAGSALCRALCP